MQRFKCHKIVTAAKIIGIEFPSFGATHGTLTLQGHESAPIPVPREWGARHQPAIGGYLVQYRDGYSSYSPSEAFENGYHFLDDGLHTARVEPVWPLRTSAKVEGELAPGLASMAMPALLPPMPTRPLFLTVAESQAFRRQWGELPEAKMPQAQLVPAPGVVPDLKVITKLPTALEVEACTVLIITCKAENEFSTFQFAVTPDWMRATKPQLGGGLVAVERGDPIYYPPGAFEPAMPTRVTKEALEAMFRSVTYEIRPDGRTTVCEITFHNKFSLRAESSAATVENFKQDLGERYAYDKALDKAWELAGFLLLEDRHRAGLKGGVA